MEFSDKRILALSRLTRVFPLHVAPRHSADQQGTERFAAAPQDMKETHTQAARLTLAHSPPVGQMLCVSETETEPSAAVLMATLETPLYAAMLTPALRAPVVQMLSVSPMETELCASVGRDMRGIRSSTVFSTHAHSLHVG